MYAGGAKYSDIMNETGASKGTVSLWCSDLAKARLAFKIQATAERKASTAKRKKKEAKEKAEKALKRVDCEHPYEGYAMYIYDCEDGRRRCQLVHKKTGKRKFMQLAKYNLSVHLGRLLGDDETVDHKDEDKANDDPSNLKILTLAQNSAKSMAARYPRLPRNCVWCDESFLHSNRRRETCSETCRRQLMSAIISDYHGSKIR